jgi:hypothetical protein
MFDKILVSVLDLLQRQCYATFINDAVGVENRHQIGGDEDP